MKKIGYIALLSILIIQAGGGLLIYKIQQYYVQMEMERALNNEETSFQQLTLSFNDFQKGKINAHEISFDGKMYDIRSIKISGDKVELLVINDTKEENIIENIKRSVNPNDQQNKGLPSQFVKLLTLVYVVPATDPDLLLQKKQRHIFVPFCDIIVSHKSDITAPPPKLG